MAVKSIIIIKICSENESPYIVQIFGRNAPVGWIPIEELKKNIVIYPKLLKDEISDISGEIKHFSFND